MQEGIKQVEVWGMKQGFRFSIEKSKVMIFTGRRKKEECQLKLYGDVLEQVDSFRFLGLHFDFRLTWKAHINCVVNALEANLNEWQYTEYGPV